MNNPYPLKDCPCCNSQIGWLNRSGKKLEYARYLKRKACEDCRGASHKATKEARTAKLIGLLNGIGRTISKLGKLQEARP